MNNRPSSALRTLTLAALLAAGGAAQANTATARYYEDALSRFEKKDYAGAVVQLKNVLKIDARDLSAQLLLGKALLENNEPGAAEVAFNEALRLGVSRAEVVLPLAKALMAQGKPDEVLRHERLAPEGLPPAVRAQLLLLRANAATDTADPRAALKAVEEARALEPTDPGSWIAEVPVRIRSRQLKEALAAGDKAVAMAPDRAEAHFARGEALHVVPDVKAALAAYDKALALEPTHVGALVARAGVHFDLQAYDAAARDIEALTKQAARDPRGVYLKALLAERQGRTADMRAALQELTALLDPIPAQFLRYRPQTQMLGGMAHHALGQYEKAKPYLEGMLRSQPGHPVSKVLASIYLAERAYDRAVELLDTYVRTNRQDPQALLLLASANSALGRHARATQIAEEALKIADLPPIRTALGMSLIGASRYGDAIQQLDKVFSKDPKQLQAGFALAGLYVQSGQADAAVRTTDLLARHHPTNPSVLDLQGRARLLKGDTAGAQKAFLAAAGVDPAFAPAQIGLARLEAATDPARATARLQAVLAKDEKQIDALLELAALAERQGQLADARRWLEKADDHAGLDNVGPAVNLVDVLLRARQVDGAREALKRAVAKQPEAVATLIASARVALAGGDATAARSTLVRASAAASNNPPVLLRVAQLQTQAGALPAAAYTLDKALDQRPDIVAAQVLRTELDIRLGEVAKAEQRARQLVARNPRLGVGHALLGEVAVVRGQHDAALAAFRQAHELEKSSESFLRLFAAHARRDKAAAVRFGEQWVATRPRDTVAWRAIADTQWTLGDAAAARRAYEALLKLQPDDAEALNNYAHVLLALNDSRALGVAEQALAKAPAAPHILGTAGWAAYKSGQNDRALQRLREARVRDPANADTRYFLATVLASTGSRTEARLELGAALKSGVASSYRADAERLLATLN
jgi:putative PEP-CTERM system TPR-repeat lipoprotein